MRQTLHLIFNAHSGQGKAQGLPDIAKRRTQENNWDLQTYELNPNEDLDLLIDKAIQNLKTKPGRIVAAGGDGTLRSVIQKIKGTSVEFGIVPCGTFNIFARTHNIPLDIDEALQVSLQGQIEKVRLGEFNNHVFLINGNIGLYAKAIRDRKPWVKTFGRNRLVASIATLWTFFKEFRPLHIQLKSDEEKKDLKVSLVFIGNSPLQLEKINLEYGSPKNLAVVIVKDLTLTDRFRLLWKGIWGGLLEENKLELHSLSEFEIDAARFHHKVVLDGEKLDLKPPFKVKSLTEGLYLVKPR